jgi:S1-C subfamily serine protease
MRQLLQTGRVSYAYVGISTEDLTPAIAKKYGYGASQGALVDKIVAGGAGARAGLRAGTRPQTFNGAQVTVGGDAIVAIDGQPVANAGDVVRIVSTRLTPGQVAEFTVVRGKKRVAVPVRLDARPQ